MQLKFNFNPSLRNGGGGGRNSLEAYNVGNCRKEGSENALN